MREKCFYGSSRESRSLLVVMVPPLSCRKTLASSFQQRRSESESFYQLVCLLAVLARFTVVVS